MNHIFYRFIILLCIISNSVIGQNKNLELEIDQFKFTGNVKSDKEYVFQLRDSFGKYTEETNINQKPFTLVYDRNKNLIMKMISGQGSDFFYKYDKENNLMEINIYNSQNGGDESLIEMIKTPYWDTISYERHYTRNNFDGKFKFKYNTNNNLLEQDHYNSSGILNFKLTYSYNTNGKVSNIQNYGNEFSIAYLDQYVYDNRGNLLSYIQENGKTVYTYDLNGSLIKESIYEYSYANPTHLRKLRLSKENFYKNKSLIKKVEFSETQLVELNESDDYLYDEHRNEISHKVKNGSENYILTSKYVYDGVGNWIKRTNYKNGTPQDGIKREIIYQ